MRMKIIILCLALLFSGGLTFAENSAFNRNDQTVRLGQKSGAHIMHPLESNTFSDTILNEARNARYPSEWSDKIMEKF